LKRNARRVQCWNWDWGDLILQYTLCSSRIFPRTTT